MFFISSAFGRCLDNKSKAPLPLTEVTNQYSPVSLSFDHKMYDIRKMVLLAMLVWGGTAAFAQTQLALDPFRLITEHKNLPADYFQHNGFKNIPVFISTGDFAKDSTAFWTEFGQWWTKYPGEVKLVQSVISLEKWQQLIDEAGKGWNATKGEQSNVIDRSKNSTPPVSNPYSDIAPHMPPAGDPDYANKKERWIQDYPEEYKKLNEPK